MERKNGGEEVVEEYEMKEGTGYDSYRNTIGKIEIVCAGSITYMR